jgi:hypothetical protein
MSLNHNNYLKQEEQPKEKKRVPAKFRSYSIDKEFDMLWTEISLIHELLEKLVEIAEWEHKVGWNTETGEMIVLNKPSQSAPTIKKDHNPYV